MAKGDDMEFEVEIKSFQPRPAKLALVDGEMREVEAPKLQITLLVPLDEVGPRVARLAYWFRHQIFPRLTLVGPEQLTHDLARRNGHDVAANIADAMVDHVDEIPLGKGIDSVTISAGGRSRTKTRGGSELAR